MHPFIRVTEIWVPNRSGTALELADGSYGTLDDFHTLSSESQFGYGEGLPGEAWRRQRPVVLKSLENTVFARTKAAQAVGLTSAVAMPIFAGEFLNAVLVFLCGDLQRLNGAIEVWEDDGQSGLGMVDGYYGDLERFEWLSKSIRFPRGRGLPGTVWQSGKPVVMGDLAHSNSFLRSRGAAEAGITTGIGIPLDGGIGDDGVDSVMTFLSSKGNPIAQRFEVWDADHAQHELLFAGGIGATTSEFEAADPSWRIAKGSGTLGTVWTSGIPVIGRTVACESPRHADGDTYKGLSSVLAIPIIRRGRLVSVVAFYS